jgi:hypothetical protein
MLVKDYDHYDGAWMPGYIGLPSLAEAEQFIEIHKKALNIRNIIGPLFLARTLENNG